MVSAAIRALTCLTVLWLNGDAAHAQSAFYQASPDAAAPATELGTLLGDDSAGGRNLTATTLWSWSRVFGAPIDRVVDPAAMPVVDRLATECIESIYDLMLRRRTSAPLEQKFRRLSS